MEQVFEQEAMQAAATETAEQVDATADLKEALEDATNPLGSKFQARLKSLEEQRPRLKKAEVDRMEKRIVAVGDAQDSADKFSQQNPELKSQILLLLLEKIKNAKTKEDILDILKQFYPDPTTAEEVLRFLLECTTGDLRRIVEEARQEHEKLYGREIRAGQNIAAEVQKYTGEGLGTPKTLRDMYRDITGNPREPLSLFQELGDRYTYKDLRKVLAFLFHSLGSDLKAQGSSIETALLHRLMSEVRSLQAILGVYQFFRARMKLIRFLFQREGLEVPQTLNFEQLAKQFVSLLQERYPTKDKAMQYASKLGIDKWLLAKIIVFSQLRDAIREVALGKLYRNLQHRDDLYNAIIELLEELEDELDELLERQQREEEEKEEGEK